MAKKSNNPKKTDSTKVTRIKASETEKPVAKKSTKPAPKTVVKSATTKVQKTQNRSTDKKKPIKKSTTEVGSETKKRGFFATIFGYFGGAWHELKQVRWPNRQETWRMTVALLIFTGFFVVVIVILDAGFKYLFQAMLG